MMVLGRQQLSESWTWQVLRGRTVKVPGGIIKCVHSAHPFLMTWHCYNGPLEIARPKASENGISDKSDFREFHIWNKNRTSILLKGSSWNCALERFWKKSGPVLPAKVRVSVCVSLWVSHGWVTTKKKNKKKHIPNVDGPKFIPASTTTLGLTNGANGRGGGRFLTLILW